MARSLPKNMPFIKGCKHSAESIEKSRIKRIGVKPSSETKKKMSDAHKKIGAPWMIGKTISEETKEKMSKAHKGNKCHLYIDGRSSNKKYVSWRANKRNRLKGATIKELGSHTYGDWELLKKQYGHTCPCCHKSEPEIKLTEDHIIPLSKGGSDLIENIQPLCLRCNIQKHAKIIKFKNVCQEK